jgi:hypothetical protein
MTEILRFGRALLMWDISDRLAAIGVTSAIEKCAVARSAHRRNGCCLLASDARLAMAMAARTAMHLLCATLSGYHLTALKPRRTG